MNALFNDKAHRAILLAPFFNAEISGNRPMSAARVLAEIAAVEVVTTDFDHGTKKRCKSAQIAPIEKINYIWTLPYHSNVGVMRLLSHLVFAFRAALYFHSHREEFDIVYVTLPMNVLAWLVLRSARHHIKIADVIDIWPDGLPFSQWLTKAFHPAFALWRRFFNLAVGKADVLLAFSDLFLAEASKYTHACCQKRRFYVGDVNLLADVPKESTLTVAYVGNIGRLYDFETLLDVLAEMKPGSIQLFILGEGDRREWLLNELKERRILHQYFGYVYDQSKFGSILCRAHIGFNGFVNTCVGISYKANTYFAAGLPILNSLPGELFRLIENHGLGMNYYSCDRASLKRCFSRLDEDVLRTMSESCRRFFSAELDRKRVHENMLAFLRGCIGMDQGAAEPVVGSGASELGTQRCSHVSTKAEADR